MRKRLVVPVFCATLLVFSALWIAANDGSHSTLSALGVIRSSELAHSPGPIPDPWELAHSPGPIPNPWEVAHSPGPIPDPWELAHSPGPIPDPWELAHSPGPIPN